MGACDKFIDTEILRVENETEKGKEDVTAVADVRKLQPLVMITARRGYPVLLPPVARQ